MHLLFTILSIGLVFFFLFVFFYCRGDLIIFKQLSESRISCIFVSDWPGLNPSRLHQAFRVSRQSEMPTSGLLKGSLPAWHDGFFNSPPSKNPYILSFCFSAASFSLFFPLSQSRLSFACRCLSQFLFSVPSVVAHYLFLQRVLLSHYFSFFVYSTDPCSVQVRSLSQAPPVACRCSFKFFLIDAGSYI